MEKKLQAILTHEYYEPGTFTARYSKSTGQITVLVDVKPVRGYVEHTLKATNDTFTACVGELLELLDGYDYKPL